MNQIVSREQMMKVHEAAIDILESTGVKVQSEQACQLLADNGASVTGQMVTIPRSMVEKAIASSPGIVPVYDRMGNVVMNLGAENVYFGTGSDTPYVIDPRDRKRRKSCKQDTVIASIVADACSDIDFVMSLGLAFDVPEMTSDLHQFEAMVVNTTKPILLTAHTDENFRSIIEMANSARGADDDKHAIILYGEPTSPLQHSSEAVTKLMTAAELKVPVVYCAAVLLGGTGPVTHAGALVMATVESLSGLVIHQLANPGAPFIYGCGTPALDMVTGACSYGSPELHVGNTAAKEIARFYDLPTFSAAGCSDSPVFDQQAAYEASYTITMAVLAGGNLVHDVGFLASGTTASLELLVASNEFIRMARKMASGLVVDDETMAVDVIKEVGVGGSFLAHKHTLNHARSSLWHSRLFSRQNHDRWVEAGSKTLADRAREEACRIIDSHRPSVEVAADARKEIADIISNREGK